MSKSKAQYLGDGVYADYDGYNVVLRLGDYRPERCDATIMLDAAILQALFEYARRMSPSFDTRPRIS